MVEPIPVTAIAERLAMKPNAVHQLLHRGRIRLRAHVEAEPRETVREPGDLDAEVISMFPAIHREAPGMAG